MKEFKVKKDGIFFFIFVLCPTLTMLFVLFKILPILTSIYSNLLLIIVVSLLVLILLTWFLAVTVFFNSKYLVDKDYLLCKFGFSKRSIKLEDINYLKEGKYPASGRRYNLSINGIIVNYGEGYSIFLSPENNSEFINALVSVNPKIQSL